MEGYLKEALDLIAVELEALSKRIQANIFVSGEYASGETSKSMKVIKSNFSASLVGREYFAALETGRKPGKGTPISVLLNWIRAKGIGTGDDKKDRSFAYLISRKHAKEGSELFRNRGRKDIYSNEIEKFVNKIENMIADKLIISVGRYIDDNNRK
jgi:hypothetical protein